MNEMMLQDVLDHVRNRFYGKYRGTVTEVDAATMRLKANVPARRCPAAGRFPHGRLSPTFGASIERLGL
jgi:hypothetical protein